MKNQALFSLKDKSKKLKCLLLLFLFGALRVNSLTETILLSTHNMITISCRIREIIPKLLPSTLTVCFTRLTFVFEVLKVRHSDWILLPGSLNILFPM